MPGDESETLVDVNVWLSRWPARRLPDDTSERLLARLRSAGITQAWAGSFDGLLHHDLGAVNERVAEECAASGGLLLPCGTIDPSLPGWEGDIERCCGPLGIRVLRVHPNYHGYDLAAPVFVEFLAACAERNLLVQLPILMEDERTQHRLLRVPTVDVTPLPELLERVPGARVMLLNAGKALGAAELARLAETGRVWCEIGMLEGVGGIERLLGSVAYERVCFGSYFPMFYLESALLKLAESELPMPLRRAIRHANAAGLLETVRPVGR